MGGLRAVYKTDVAGGRIGTKRTNPPAGPAARLTAPGAPHRMTEFEYLLARLIWIKAAGPGPC
jgi:hypothetical protein